MPTEGKKYDNDKPPMDLLSSIAMEEIAKVMGFGAKKYARHNWKAGLNWSRVLAASLRHIMAFNRGEDSDPETGLSHIAHASCCLMFLLEYIQTHPELDDRYKPIQKQENVVTSVRACEHRYFAPLDNNKTTMCVDCKTIISVEKEHSCL